VHALNRRGLLVGCLDKVAGLRLSDCFEFLITAEARMQGYRTTVSIDTLVSVGTASDVR
jgi:hypothetical protein